LEGVPAAAKTSLRNLPAVAVHLSPGIRRKLFTVKLRKERKRHEGYVRGWEVGEKKRQRNEAKK